MNLGQLEILQKVIAGSLDRAIRAALPEAAVEARLPAGGPVHPRGRLLRGSGIVIGGESRSLLAAQKTGTPTIKESFSGDGRGDNRPAVILQ